VGGRADARAGLLVWSGPDRYWKCDACAQERRAVYKLKRGNEAEASSSTRRCRSESASSMEMSRPPSSHQLFLPPHRHHRHPPLFLTTDPLEVLHAARRPLDNVLHGALRAADGLLHGALGPANRLLDDALGAADGLHDDTLGTADTHFWKVGGFGGLGGGLEV
jgi:hypothetical protein